MRSNSWELILSLIIVAAVSAVFALAPPRNFTPGGPLGHTLGVIGFLMMLASETLYTLRKRLRAFHFGPMNAWLKWHVVTGIVGPFLVVLHSAGKFHGLAGALTLLTVVMVLSGFVGRHIYTAVPRTLDGAEVAAEVLNEQIDETWHRLEATGIDLSQIESLLTEPPPRPWVLVLSRGWYRRRQERRMRKAISGLTEGNHADAARLRGLLSQRLRLQMQVQSLSATRNLLALWHLFHVPLGIVVFTLAFVHVAAALYYSTLSK